MSGLFLIFFIVFGCVLLFCGYAYETTSESCRFKFEASSVASVIGIVFIVIGCLFIAAIPISYFESKENVQNIQAFKQVYDESRNLNLNAVERVNLINQINEYNKTINDWKLYGDNWYASKWFLHPSTKGVQNIK